MQPDASSRPLLPIVIEGIAPQIDAGQHAIKRVVGDRVEVSARVFKDGHDVLAASVRYRAERDTEWSESPMHDVGESRFVGSFQVESNEGYVYTVEAWLDRYATWRRDLRKRIDAAQDVTTELREGANLLRATAERAVGPEKGRLERVLARLDGLEDPTSAAAILCNPDLADLVARWQPRELVTRYEPTLSCWVDRPRARFASWYEFFPRSEGASAGKSGTFRSATKRLDAIRAMAFDVVYLPPIHPVGRTARKGPNNTLTAGPDDPGSPWAIGNEQGGHDAVEPSLGTLADFEAFVARAKDLGLEIAIDFALQCSPDHPWVKQHPEWFFHRPDGTIKYAENPPKKYQDIYPINFWGPHREALWNEILRVLEFWIARGVRTFRVDNPHTKPIAMWQQVIERIHARRPDVLFLAEAFTAPHMMRALAKVGFSQSYTYFTWKTSKWELTEYVNELSRSEMREYFRGNLWPNTPDILHEFLTHSRRPAFSLRAVLAATLSPLWGIYSGYELMENVPVRPGSEEYLDSEKYQYKPRDWNQADSLAPYITRLNIARRENRALQLYGNVEFVQADHPNVIAYVRATEDRSNVVIVAVNLDPANVAESDVWIEPSLLGVLQDQEYSVHDLLSDEVFTWRGGKTWVRLDPFKNPAHVLVVKKR